MSARAVLRTVDTSIVLVVVGVVLVMAYVRSHGGLGKALAHAGIDTMPRIRVSSNPRDALPPVESPATPSRAGGELLLQPIEASMGAESPFVRPMSATTYGPIKVTAADLADPARAQLFFMTGDGNRFVTLPERSSMGVGAGTSAERPVPSTATKPVPDLFHAFAPWLFSRGEAKPRVAQVS